MKQTNHKIWRISSVLTLILALFVSSSNAQPLQPSISGGRLLVFPQSYQLYPRNTNTNQGTVSFSVRMRNGGPFTHLRLTHIKDENNDQNYLNDPIISTTDVPISGVIVNDSIDISFSNINIVAELRNHRFRLSGINGATVTDLITSSDVVSGDVFLIQGQSNSYAERRLNNGDANAETNARFVRSYGSSHLLGYAEYARNWGLAQGNGNDKSNYNVGMWGMRLASKLTITEGIPIAIFCGGYGDNILIFRKISDAYPSSPYEQNNYYRLYKRTVDAGVVNNIRGIFWWQGESDAFIDVPSRSKNSYINEFNGIYSSWMQDYGGSPKVFIIQIRLGCYYGVPPINNGLAIMQAQLEIAKNNQNIEILSTQNLDHIDEGWYCHYGWINGYQKAGDLFLPTVRQALYGLSQNPNTRFAYPIGADVSSTSTIPTQVSVRLNEANDNFSIVPLIGSNIQDYFRLEGGSYTITSISVENNFIRINFTNNSGTIPQAVSYFGRHQFGAPVIENAGGHAIVAFTQPIVGGSLPVDPLSLTVSRNGGAHQLRWKAESNERFDQFVVERGETRNSFKPVYDVYGTGQSGTIQYDFTDNKPNATVSHYRIRAIQQDGKELFSQVVTVNNRLNNVKEFRVFPNPVAGSANATINMNEAALATINLHDASGRLLSSRKLQLQKGNNQFSLGELLDYNPGTYIVRVITATETQQIRVVKAK